MNKELRTASYYAKKHLFSCFVSLLIYSCNTGGEANKGATGDSSTSQKRANPTVPNADALPWYIYLGYTINTEKFIAVVTDPNFKTLFFIPTNKETAASTEIWLLPKIEVKAGSPPIDTAGLLVPSSRDLRLHSALTVVADPNAYRMERLKPADSIQLDFLKQIIQQSPNLVSLTLNAVNGKNHQDKKNLTDQLCYDIGYMFGNRSLFFNIDSFLKRKKLNLKWIGTLAFSLEELNPRPPGGDPAP